MATSGSADYTVDRDDILDRAGQLLGIVPEGGSCSANQYADLAAWLNMMIKHWQTQGIQLWLRDEIILFPVKAQASYHLGGSSTDRMTRTEQLVKTEIATAAENTDTTITVDSITNIAASDVIGIETDSEGIHWTTVNGSPSGSTITLTNAMDDDAAVGNNVYTYTTAFSDRPVKILHAFRRDDDNNDIPVEIVSHQEYNSLTTKSQAGVPLFIYPDYQRDSTELYVWPVPGQSDLDTLLYLSIQRPVEDFDASGNNPDFPQEWYLALAYNVAFFAAPVYALSEQRYNRIAGMSVKLLDELLDWSTEDFSIFIQPDTRQ